MYEKTANKLWKARVEGYLQPANFEGCPTTEGDAYKIQRAMIDLTDDNLVGWKLGATATAAIEMLKVDGVFVGPLFNRFTVSSGSEIKLFPAQNPALETEFSVRIGNDIPWRPEKYDQAEIAKSIHAVIPSFEIISSRYERDASPLGYRVIADGGSNYFSVIGQEIRDWSSVDLRDHPVNLNVNGKQVATGSNAILIWEHTFDAVAWLANHDILRGRGLKSGDLVMTGTCTGATPLKSGDIAEADFGEIGQVKASFI